VISNPELEKQAQQFDEHPAFTQLNDPPPISNYEQQQTLSTPIPPSPTTLQAPCSPSSIPEFTPLAVLGRGAFSKILLVQDKMNGQLYAMKVLRKIDVVTIGHETHVLTEQAILSRMSHPFVCRLYYAFQSTSKLYMVMSYAAGGDLFTLLRRRTLSEKQVAFYMAELVCALRYIHIHNVGK
jgi:serine/threonine protein kinase